MSRISATFKRLRWEKEAALIPYLTVGYPSLESTLHLVPLMARQGADLILLGVPPTSLLTDKVLQRAAGSAVDAGISLTDCLNLASDCRRANEVPLVLVSSQDALADYTPTDLAEECMHAGVDGLLVVDLPPDQAPLLKAAFFEAGLDLIRSIDSTSIDEQIKEVVDGASGFIFCATPGGGNNSILHDVRQYTTLPLVAGIDVRSPEEAGQLAQQAQGIIVAGELVRLIDSLPEEEILYSVGEFVRDVKEATKLHAE